MDFDCFDDPEEEAPAACAALAPRASEHPHFRQSHWLWPAAAADAAPADEPFGHATRLLLRQRVDACAASLRKARSDAYAGAAAAALLAACAALERDDGAALREEAARCEDFCALQLEEGDWSAAAWQEGWP